MNITLALSGHWHRTQYYEAGIFKNFAEPANFPLIVGTRPGSETFIANALEIGTDSIQAWLTNQNHEITTTYPLIPIVH